MRLKSARSSDRRRSRPQVKALLRRGFYYLRGLPAAADLDAAVGGPDVVGGLGDAGRAVDDRPVLQAEDAAVPGALDAGAGVVDLALLERPAGVAAHAADGQDPI